MGVVCSYVLLHLFKVVPSGDMVNFSCLPAVEFCFAA